MEQVRVPERSHGHRGGGAGHDHAVLAGYRRAGFIGERGNLFGPDFPPRFPMLAVAVQRDRAANWLFALSSYQPPDDLARQSVGPARRALRQELHERRKLRRYLCSELGA